MLIRRNSILAAEYLPYPDESLCAPYGIGSRQGVSYFLRAANEVEKLPDGVFAQRGDIRENGVLRSGAAIVRNQAGRDSWTQRLAAAAIDVVQCEKNVERLVLDRFAA